MVRASHKPTYTPDQQHHLDWYNKRVPLWLYISITIILLVFGVSNWVNVAVRTHYVRKYGTSRRLSAEARMGRTSLRFLPEASCALLKKAAYGADQLAYHHLGLESLAQVGMLLAYFAVVAGIAFSGAEGHIDYQARHCAQLFNASLPLVVGLAAKELSFISWITGISVSSLNKFHGWLAVLLLLLASIHVFGTIYVNSPEIRPSQPHNFYQVWGIFSFVLFVILIAGSARYIRWRWFKIFVFGHVLVFTLALITLSIHRPQVSPYVIVALLIYFSDRIIRTGFLLYYNFIKGLANPPVGTIEILDPNTLRVVFRTSISWKPAQHCYLHFPLLAAGGHPFPISSNPNSPSFQVFLIPVEASGISQQLYQTALENTETTATYPSTSPIYPAWIERPSGGRLGIEKFETVCLINEGVGGIAWSVGLVDDLARRWRDDGLVTKRVFWVWVVEDVAHVEWVADNLRDIITSSPDDFLDFRIYLTGERLRVPTPRERSAEVRRSFLNEDVESDFGLEPPELPLSPGVDDGLSRTHSAIASTGHRSIYDLSLEGIPEVDTQEYHQIEAPKTSVQDTLPSTEREETQHLSPVDTRLERQRTQSQSQPSTRSDLFVSATEGTSLRGEGSIKSNRSAAVQSTDGQLSLYARSGEHSQHATIEEFPRPPQNSTSIDRRSSRGSNSSALAGTKESSKWSWLTIGNAEQNISIPICEGRPDLVELVEAVVTRSDYSDSVWVGTCAGKKFMREVGQAVAEAIDVDRVCMGEHRRSPMFHSESFEW